MINLSYLHNIIRAFASKHDIRLQIRCKVLLCSLATYFISVLRRSRLLLINIFSSQQLATNANIRIPSTPNIEYYPDIFNSVADQESQSKSLSHYLKLQESSSSSSFKSDVTDRFGSAARGGSGGLSTLDLLRKSPLAQRKLINTPESSQTDSDDVSPQIQRKRKTGHSRDPIPRFSISIEDDRDELETSAAAAKKKEGGGSFELIDVLSKHRSRAIVKSASDLGLSLLMRSENGASHVAALGAAAAANVVRPGHLYNRPLATQAAIQSPLGGGIKSVIGFSGGGGGNGGSSSTASSRDTSPCRDLSPLVTNLKPPIVIRRGPRGFGFTVHTIRVFYGDSDVYTMHHLVAAVEEQSPAFEAGLRPADLITHVNGEPVQGLYHTQVLQLLLSCSEHVMIRATPLTNTSIQAGGRKRDLGQSKLAKRSVAARNRRKKEHEKKRKTSLFRRISSKRANAEIQQYTAGQTTPTIGGGGGGGPPLPSLNFPGQRLLNFVPFDSTTSTSQSSSPNSSVPNTPTGGGCPIAAPLYQRPSSLHGLKHKLHNTAKGGGGGGGGLHASNTPTTPNRRKSVAHIPLSPLARTPSPTRSPSPLTFPTAGHHPPGSSNTTQSYSPTVSNNNSGTNLNVSGGAVSSSCGPGPGAPQVLTGSAILNPVANANPSNCIVTRRSFSRPKSAEHNPLLRRALSPDRPHHHHQLLRSTGEPKCASVSPLCQQPTTSSRGGGGVSNGGGGNTSTIQTVAATTTSGVWRSPSATAIVPSVGSGSQGFMPVSPKLTAAAATTSVMPTLMTNTSAAATFLASSRNDESVPNKKDDLPSLTLPVQQCAAASELLPRIAEEKDSPTSVVNVVEVLSSLKGVTAKSSDNDVYQKETIPKKTDASSCATGDTKDGTTNVARSGVEREKSPASGSRTTNVMSSPVKQGAASKLEATARKFTTTKGGVTCPKKQ